MLLRNSCKKHNVEFRLSFFYEDFKFLLLKIPEFTVQKFTVEKVLLVLEAPSFHSMLYFILK